MTNFKRTLLASVAFGLMLATAPAARAGDAPKPDREQDMLRQMDDAFTSPGSPNTYRVLSRMALPEIPADADSVFGYSDWPDETDKDKAMVRQLFQGIDKSEYRYPRFGSCRPQAPLRQIHERQQQFGGNHPYFAQWLSVERVLLSVCFSDGKPADPVALPAPLATSDPAVALLQRQDRAYQQAAMLFYQRKNADALAGFQAIAQDKTSPNRPLAAYMVLAIEGGSHIGWEEPDGVKVPPEQTRQHIREVLADPSLKSIHGMAAALFGWMGYNGGDPAAVEAQVKEAVSALLVPADRLEKDAQSLKRYFAAQEDIKFLFSHDKEPELVLTGKLPESYTATAALSRMVPQEPFAAWLGLMPSEYQRRTAWALDEIKPESEVVRDYLERMTAGRENVGNPWVHIDPDLSTARLTALVDEEQRRLSADIGDRQAAAALGLDFYSLIRHLMSEENGRGFKTALSRLESFPYKSTDTFANAVTDSFLYLVAKGRIAEAREFRDALGLERPEQSGGVFEALMVLAENEERLVRVLALSRYHVGPEYLNHLSTAELWRLAGRSEIEKDRRGVLARAAWTRDFALGRTIGVRNDALMRSLSPEITANWRSPSGRDVRPGNITLVRDLLKSPGMNIEIQQFSRLPTKEASDSEKPGLTGLDRYNHSDNNWWCGWYQSRNEVALSETLAQTFALDDSGNYYSWTPEEVARRAAMHRRNRKMLAPAMRDSFLFKKVDAQELRQLSQAKCAPRLLSERVIAWVRNTKSSQSRDGQAEALADAVAATRWGCNRENHQAYSLQAFTLLHVHFPDTAAAKRTPYWFARTPSVERPVPAL